MPRDSKQVNIRVDPDTYEVLESAAFVRGYRGMQELLEPIIEREVTTWARQAAVRHAIAARRKQAASES
jgi:uncharacterized protein (DUF1778 family)